MLRAKATATVVADSAGIVLRRNIEFLLTLFSHLVMAPNPSSPLIRRLAVNVKLMKGERDRYIPEDVSGWVIVTAKAEVGRA